jgi:hypothetical protein
MHRRPRLAIRVQILLLLKKVPMGSLELSQKIGCSLEELERELFYLKAQGRIEEIRSEKFNMYFWRLKKN